MRVPSECYPLQAAIETYLPTLRPAHQRALAVWVFGAVLAGSACQSAVLHALAPVCGRRHLAAVRQQLREWCYAGADKAAPCHTDVAVTACFAPLLRWGLAWWQGDALPLALDATYLRDRLVVLSVSVLYRGTAIPVAWHVTAANRPGAWRDPACTLFTTLAPALPPDRLALVLADRGLWSPAIWRAIRTRGWHPLLRIRPDATFRPTGGQRGPARRLVAGPGAAWVGRGIAFKHTAKRLAATLVVVWEVDQAEPWLILTDLAPEAVGPAWYGLRTWVELGFRALKRFGWQWQRTRRTDPDRVARHWLVLAVATLWVVATGTREEDAERVGRCPAHLTVAVLVPPDPTYRRPVSCFRRGLLRVRWQLLRMRHLWTTLWLRPDPAPVLPATITLTVVPSASPPSPP